MDDTLAAWLPGSFDRAPSWRWSRATWLREQRRSASPRLDDVWVRRALAFLAAQDAGKAQVSARRGRPDPGVAAAVDLFGEGVPARRSELEARLLTEQPLEKVAHRCSLTPEAVEAYEALFFNVRDRLRARDWVAARVIGPGLWRGFRPEETGRLWMAVAYAGGAVALDVLLAVMRDQPLPESVRAGFRDHAYEESRLRLLVKLAVAALRAQSAEELRALAALYEEAVAVDRDSVGTAPRLKGGLGVARLVLGLAAGTEKKPSLREKALAGVAARGAAPEARSARHERTPAVLR